MSLLSSFSSDFNRTMDVYVLSTQKNWIWEKEKSYTKQQQTIEWLLLPNKAEYDKFSWSQKSNGANWVIYDIFEYKFRCEFWPSLKKWDKLQDEFWKSFEIKRIVRNPWFGGDDHLLLYLNECDGI